MGPQTCRRMAVCMLLLDKTDYIHDSNLHVYSRNANVKVLTLTVDGSNFRGGNLQQVFCGCIAVLQMVKRHYVDILFDFIPNLELP